MATKVERGLGAWLKGCSLWWRCGQWASNTSKITATSGSGPAWRADLTPALHQGFLLPEAPLPVKGVEAGAVLGWINTDKTQRAAELGQDHWREEFRLLPLAHVHVPNAAD